MSDKFEAWWQEMQGKIVGTTIAIILSIGGMLYSDTRQDIKSLEERVAFLYVDKVSRQELKEELNQLRMQNDANKSDIIARQDILRNDVLQRIDMLSTYIREK